MNRRNRKQPKRHPHSAQAIQNKSSQTNQPAATNNAEEHDSSGVTHGLVSEKIPTEGNAHNETRSQNTFAHYLREYFQKPKTYFELVGLGVLIWYACTTYRLWQAQGTANGLATKGLELQQRAYLTYGTIDTIPSGVKVHLSNIGHVPGKVMGGSSQYLRVSYPDNGNIADVSASLPGGIVVAPGSDSDAAILFDLPQFPATDESRLKAGREIAVNATVRYETGFNSTDTLDIRIMYEWQTDKWVHVNYGTKVHLVYPG